MKKVGEMAKAKKGKTAKPKSRPKKARPRKGKPEKTVPSMDKKAASLAAELTNARKQILRNESVLAQKIGEKMAAEDQLNRMLRQNFSQEKALLAAVKKSNEKKEETLRKKIASLQTINKVFEQKKARISEAKKRQAALKKQLRLLESKTGA